MQARSQTDRLVTEERVDEYERVCCAVALWARSRDDIVAAAIVGSWARGAARTSSDVDLVLLTSEKERYVADDGWTLSALGQEAELVRTKEWGPLTERRVRLPSGLEVDFGFVDPAWAATDPVDPGTASVVLNGCQPILDPEGVLEAFMAAVGAPKAP